MQASQQECCLLTHCDAVSQGTVQGLQLLSCMLHPQRTVLQAFEPSFDVSATVWEALVDPMATV